MEKAKLAVDYFCEGYNCAQAVLLAYCKECNLDEKTAAMLASSFGGGMGKMREVCGAVSAMFMVAGIKRGYSDPKATTEKNEHYTYVKELADKFKAEHGSIICRELLASIKTSEGSEAEERTPEYYKVRPCAKFIATAAELAKDI